MPVDLDDLDLGLLAALSDDPALTNTELAARLFSTDSTVRRRRAALLKAGVYREGILVNPGALGYSILAMVGIQVEYNRMEEIQEAVSRLPQLRFIGRTLGRYDLLAGRIDSRLQLAQLYEELGQFSASHKYRDEALSLTNTARRQERPSHHELP